MVSAVLELRGVEALCFAEIPSRSHVGAARKTAQRFANEGDAAAPGFDSLFGDDGGIAGQIDGARARFRKHRREAAR
jgi:hypothetical protein